jgi:hypothetical protein
MATPASIRLDVILYSITFIRAGAVARAFFQGRIH